MLLTDYGGLNEDELDLLSGYVFPFAHWLFLTRASTLLSTATIMRNSRGDFKRWCRTHSCCCDGMKARSGPRRKSRGDARDPVVNSNPWLSPEGTGFTPTAM